MHRPRIDRSFPDDAPTRPRQPMTTVLITGANRGLGLEFTRQYLDAGAAVIATCRDPTAADDLARLGERYAGRLDVVPLTLPDEAGIAALAAHVGQRNARLDLVVANAGILVSGERFGTVRLADLTGSFAANAAGPLLLVQALAPHLAPGAKVVMVSSTLGSLASTNAWGTPSYAISKAALGMVVRLTAAALRGAATVVAIDPGWVQTRMGGPRAPLAAADSVRDIRALVARLAPSDSGRLVDRHGEPVAW